MADGLQNKKVGFIIQARMQSSRLPGKILMPMPLNGKIPLLGWIIKALKKSTLQSTIYIATSTKPENDELVEFSNKNGVFCFRGSEDDVLSRFTAITNENDFDAIVRLTADNPVLDINILDKTIAFHFSSGADYTSTQGLPLGMNFEILKTKSLKSVNTKSLKEGDKEHVTSYIRNSGLFSTTEYKPFPDKEYSNIRLTVDYPSDFLVVSTLISIGESLNMEPGLELVDHCIENHPWIFGANAQNHQKREYENLQEEWLKAEPLLEKYGFKRIVSLIKKSI